MTVSDLIRFQRAYRAGRLVSSDSVRRLERARHGGTGGTGLNVVSGADAFGFNAALAEFGGKDAYIAVITNTNRVGAERADRLVAALVPVLASGSE